MNKTNENTQIGLWTVKLLVAFFPGSLGALLLGTRHHYLVETVGFIIGLLLQQFIPPIMRWRNLILLSVVALTIGVCASMYSPK